MSHPSSDDPLQLLFLGTGTSTGLPLTPCLTLSNPYPEGFRDMVPLLEASSSTPPTKGSWDPQGSWPSNIPCPCCRSAVDPDVPDGWKNKRGNVSVVLRKKDPLAMGGYRNVLVDVGKTFRENAGRYFPKWGVRTIDAVLLTHGHADAYFGLDDLREWCQRQGKAIPVYLNRETYEKVADAFPYMIDKTKASGGGDVPRLIWHVIDNESEFEIESIRIKTLPVHHGIYFHSVAPTSATSQTRLEPEPLICLGFMFDESVVYLSDVSDIPERTWERMLDRGQTHNKSLPTPRTTPSPNAIDGALASTSSPLPILIIDALWPLRPHASHYGLSQALFAALRLQPSYTYLMGSTHPTTHYMWEELCLSLANKHGQRDHPDKPQSDWLVSKFWEKVMRKDGLDEKWKEFKGVVRPAWDGLVLDVPKAGEKVDDVENVQESTRGVVY